jgi:anti-sigma factor RsiW
MNAPMKHEDAIRTQAVERYLLRQMTEEERAIFEEHYFECDDCAGDVADGTQLMIAGRYLGKKQREAEQPAKAANVVPMPVPAPRPFRWPVAASLAFTLLGGLTGYLIGRKQQPPDPTGVIVRLDTGTRRAGTPVRIPAVQTGDELKFDVPPSDDAAEYAAIVTCGGKTELTHGISREMAADAVSLRIGELPAGRCELVIQGVRKDGKRFLITRNPFKVGER